MRKNVVLKTRGCVHGLRALWPNMGSVPIPQWRISFWHDLGRKPKQKPAMTISSPKGSLCGVLRAMACLIVCELLSVTKRRVVGLPMRLVNLRMVSMAKVYDRVALIGLGLIASSMYWAIKRGGLADHVTGYARSKETRQTAREIGLCDTVCDSIADAVQGADLVVLCVPVGAMGAVAEE